MRKKKKKKNLYHVALHNFSQFKEVSQVVDRNIAPAQEWRVL